MNYEALEENAGRLVSQLFESPHRVLFPYHNLLHTTAVVQHAKEISAKYSLSKMEQCILAVAAWFHDTGHLFGPMEQHEERSRVIMLDYLHTTEVPNDFIEQAGNCVLVTKYKANPRNIIEQVICDADTFHFGTDYFHTTEYLMKLEMELRTGQQFPHWHMGSIQLLKTHVFHTEYCQALLNAGKEANLLWLETL